MGIPPRPAKRKAVSKLEACSERQQGDVPGLLDGTRKAALMRGANAGQTTRHNLAALRDKALQQAHVAIRNRIDLLGAELAHLLAAEKLAAATRATARTAATALPGPRGGAGGGWPRTVGRAYGSIF